MVQRGLLGNITYNDSEHSSAVDAGEILGGLSLATISSHSGAELYSAEDAQAQLSRLQNTLNSKAIGWTAPAQYDSRTLGQIINVVRVQIKNCSSPIHCACLYLGLAKKNRGWVGNIGEHESRRRTGTWQPGSLKARGH